MLAIVSLLAFESCGGKEIKTDNTQVAVNGKVEDTATVTNNDSKSPDIHADISADKKLVSGEILHLSDNNFEEKISQGIVLVDFWATWCKPCLMQAPILEEVNKEMAGKITIAKLDIDKNKVITDRYGVMNIPTMLLFKNGKQVNQFVGLTEKEILIKAINNEL